MFYNNISGTHENEKTPALIQEFHEAISKYNINHLIILGAQLRNDVRTLLHESDKLNINVDCFDIRQSEISHWMNTQSFNANFWCADVDNLARSSWLHNHTNTPTIIYDNLCGSPRRIPFWKKFLELPNINCILAYVYRRTGTTKAAKNVFGPLNVTQHAVAETADIIKISKDNSGGKYYRYWRGSNSKLKEHLNREERIAGIVCPTCGAHGHNIWARKTMIPEFNCTRCKIPFDRKDAGILI